MARSELLIPPSTANSDSAWPLSFSIASRMALVWKQVASSVALAMWPFLVYCVIPTNDCQRVNKNMVYVSYI
jgi:hypothetical protein